MRLLLLLLAPLLGCTAAPLTAWLEGTAKSWGGPQVLLPARWRALELTLVWRAARCRSWGRSAAQPAPWNAMQDGKDPNIASGGLLSGSCGERLW